MIKIAIVDDDKIFRDMINNYINQFFAFKSIEYNTILFSSGEDFLSSLDNETYDVVFMDVQMNGINGIDTSKKLREIDDNIIIVFFTNYSQYAIKGYEVNASDFVVKPVTYDFFAMKMESIYHKITTKKKSTRIMFSSRNKKVILDSKDILSIEVLNHKLTIRTINNEYETYDYSLSDLENIFNENKLDYFSRINKYIIVNLNYIESIEGNTVTINKKDYAVSRLKKAKLLQSMSKFFAKGNY